MTTTTIKNPASKSVLSHWKGQRISAALIVIFTLLILAQLVFTKGPLGYESWAGIFSSTWMRILTVITVIAIAWHAWLGMGEIFMDYIKSTGLKSALQFFTAIWLLGSIAWLVSVLWKF